MARWVGEDRERGGGPEQGQRSRWMWHRRIIHGHTGGFTHWRVVYIGRSV
jgi:hypothetical protein